MKCARRLWGDSHGHRGKPQSRGSFQQHSAVRGTTDVLVNAQTPWAPIVPETTPLFRGRKALALPSGVGGGSIPWLSRGEGRREGPRMCRGAVVREPYGFI